MDKVCQTADLWGRGRLTLALLDASAAGEGKSSVVLKITSELQVLLGLLLVPIPRQISAFLVELWSFLWLFFHRILQKLSVSGFRRAISQHTRQPWSSCLNATLKINICTVPNKCFNILLSLNSPVISRKENSDHCTFDALPARSSLNHHTFFPKSPCCHTPSVHSCQSVGVELLKS